MRVVTLLALAALCLPAALGAASAADEEQPAEYVPAKVGSGWYLRGDVSYAVSNRVDLDGALTRERTRVGAGIGAGYRFTDMLRADIDVAFVDRVRFGFADALSTGSTRTLQWAGTASLYADLGTVAGFTPYVGAGAGFLRSDTESERTLLDGTRFSASDEQTKFAYALDAGVAYQMGQNTQIDLGYRYLSSPDTRTVDPRTGATRDGVDIHQLRIGLRYGL